MARLPPMFNENLAYSAAVTRSLVGGMFTLGVFGSADFRVTQRAAGANWSVDIAPGAAAISGDATDGGVYLCRSTATENFAPPGWSAPPAGQQRRDVITLNVQDTEPPFSKPTDEWQFVLRQGTPAASNPVQPGWPGSDIALARIDTTSSSTSVTNSMLTDYRPFAEAAPYRGTLQANLATPGDVWALNASSNWFPSTAVTLPNPNRLCRVESQVTCNWVPNDTMGSTFGEVRAETSTNGGASWTSSQAVAAYAEHPLAPCPVTAVTHVVGIPTGSCQARLSARQMSGRDARMSSICVILRIWPSG